MTPRDSNHATGSGERSAAPPRLGSQAHLFDVPGEIAYFNTANMSPLLRSVREAGELGLARRAAPWRIRSVDWINDVERLRDALAQLVGVDSDGVALVPATS